MHEYAPQGLPINIYDIIGMSQFPSCAVAMKIVRGHNIVQFVNAYEDLHGCMHELYRRLFHSND